MGLLWIYHVKELCNALALLSAAMQSIGGESYCSLSLVRPLLHKLISKVMVPAAEDTPIVYDFKAAALRDLKITQCSSREIINDRRGVFRSWYHHFAYQFLQ